MKKQFIAAAALLFTLGLSVQQIISNPTGAPAQASGGPAEGGATCFQAGCHFGAPTTVTDILTTDIPSAGYTAGTTYNITATVAGTGQKGLMVSAQNSTGHLGTLISGSGTKIVFSGKYLTHTSSKTGSSATWTFKWTAPAAGSGAVTFYGAFAITQNITRKQELTIQENTTTAINEINNSIQLATWPNPVTERMNLSFNTQQTERQTISLLSIDGKLSKVLFDQSCIAGPQELSFDVSDLKDGIYLLNVSSPTSSSCRKVLIQH